MPGISSSGDAVMARLRFARWAPPAGRKGTVCVFTGRSEQIEKYFETVRDLRDRGDADAVAQLKAEISAFQVANDQLEASLLKRDAHMKSLDAEMPLETARAYLGRFGLSGELATKPIGVLSGGQKSRLAFAELAWKQPHIMLLDEPTNHLDLETIEALAMALNNFEGGVVLIVEEYNPPCSRMSQHIADHYHRANEEPLGQMDFIEASKFCRGLVGAVEVPGIVSVGEGVTVKQEVLPKWLRA